jgi:hypothetical protein
MGRRVSVYRGLHLTPVRVIKMFSERLVQIERGRVGIQIPIYLTPKSRSWLLKSVVY